MALLVQLCQNTPYSAFILTSKGKKVVKLLFLLHEPLLVIMSFSNLKRTTGSHSQKETNRNCCRITDLISTSYTDTEIVEMNQARLEFS